MPESMVEFEDNPNCPPYHKIHSLFKRDSAGNIICGSALKPSWSLAEFEYLKNLPWDFTEKIDGTNIRVYWSGQEREFRGRTNRAVLYAPLLKKLEEVFPHEKLQAALGGYPACLYGEGFGAKIQKVGHKYIPDGVDFVLFDVLIGGWWLKREDVEQIAASLGIKTAPYIGSGSLLNMTERVRAGIKSAWGDFPAEGLIGRPQLELKDRAGRRIIAKLKTRDFDFLKT